MANLYPIYKFYLNGNLVNPPEDWLDLEILATFENNSPEANITTESLTFVNEEAVLIRNWIRNGLTGGVGIFEGMPFKVQILNTNNIYDSFEGYLDLTDAYSEISPVRVTCKIKKTAGIISFTDRVDGLTFNYLRELGIFNASDLEIYRSEKNNELNSMTIDNNTGRNEKTTIDFNAIEL